MPINCKQRSRLLCAFWPRALVSTGIFTAALGFGVEAAAQIVNTESLFRSASERPYSFTAEGSVNGQRGNTDLFVLGLSTAGRARDGDHEGLFNGSHDRSSARDELVGNRSVGHLRYRYYLTERVQMEAYGQAAQDRFRLMTHRFVGGAGPRFVPVRVSPLTWTIAFSHLYEVEQLDGSVDFPGGLTRKRHRLNVMSNARLELDRLTLNQTIYAQPAWADPSNIRVLHIFLAQAAINDWVSLTWSLEQALDSIAPSDVRWLDVRFKGGLKFDL